MTHSYEIATVLLTCLLLGCATVDDHRSESRRQLMSDLRKACIEANGGLQMDAVGLYGGQLSANCSALAYQKARQAIR